MKRIFLLTAMLLITLVATAQKVHISGKFLNCTEKQLELVLNSSTRTYSDTIFINTDGSFNYETTKIITPCLASITNRKQIQVQLFLAPGFDLQINGDVKDYNTARKTTKYTGVGGRSNQYWEELFKDYKPDTVKWFKKDADAYVKHLLETPKFAGIRDTIFNADNKDPYKDYFKQGFKTDQQYAPLIALFSSYAYENNYNWQQIEQMIHKLGKDSYMEDLNNEQNMISGSFRYFVSSFPFYCDVYNAYPADSLLKKEGNYTLYLADKFFKGKVYDYVAGLDLEHTLSSTYKFDDLKKLTVYIHKINDENRRKELEVMIRARETAASGLQAGNPSPIFSLTDTTGKTHSLADFKGKVVYIDLWASWCGPCREENPFLKKVYSHYKNNNQLAIISIATFDAKNKTRRYEIIKKEQMEWLQLEDTTDSFARSYQASFIPRFIIIDKKGNIVDSDAPRPSDGNKLTDILNREINKY